MERLLRPQTCGQVKGLTMKDPEKWLRELLVGWDHLKNQKDMCLDFLTDFVEAVQEDAYNDGFEAGREDIVHGEDDAA